MKKIFYLTFSIFVLLWAVFAYTVENVSLEVRQIDQKIKILREEKRGYEARALRHENQAERFQFDSNTTLEARRHYAIAEENREKARQVEIEIQDLLKERKKLIGQQ